MEHQKLGEYVTGILSFVSLFILFWPPEQQASHFSFEWLLFSIVVGCNGWIPTPQAVPLSLVFLVGIYKDEHAYADKGENIIYAYVQLLLK